MAKKVTAKKPARKTSPRKGKADSSAGTRPKSFPKPDTDQLVQEINMKFGDNGPVMRSAKEAWDASDLRRPCGIMSLDLAAGGGLVAGKVHQIDGPESTGKNYLMYRYFGQLQNHYGDDACLAMACFESFVDKHFAQMCGCKIAMSHYDIEVTQRGRKRRGEEPLTAAEIKEAMNCPTVGKFYIFEGASEGVLGGIVDAVKSNAYQMIGIDSWDAMMTFQEETTPLGETPQVASPASLQTRWSKQILDAFNPTFRCPECGYSPLEKNVINSKTLNFKYICGNCKWSGLDPFTEVNETTLYCIRQARAKLNLSGGKSYGRAYKSDGAFALQHLNHIRISLHAGQALRDKKVKIGKEVNWEVAKAKAGAREGRIGAFTLYFDPLEVDVQGDLLAQCLIYNVILSEGSGRYSIPTIEDADGNAISVHGKESLLQLMEQSPELMVELRDQLYIAAGLGHVRFR